MHFSSPLMTIDDTKGLLLTPCALTCVFQHRINAGHCLVHTTMLCALQYAV